MVSNQLLCRQGEQCLAPMSHGKQASYAVEGRACIVPVLKFGLAGVQGHAHLERGYLCAPRLGMEGKLGVQGSLQSARGGGESGSEGVTLGAEDKAAISLYSRSEDVIMSPKGNLHGLGEVLPARGRA